MFIKNAFDKLSISKAFETIDCPKWKNSCRKAGFGAIMDSSHRGSMLIDPNGFMKK